MHLVDGPNNVGGLFQAGNPFLDLEGTTITVDWLNALQLEIKAAIEEGGGSLDKGNNAQLRDAMIAIAIAHAGSGGEPSNGNKGDLTVSGSGLVWDVNANAIGLAKLADMATASLLGRATAGTGDPEVLSAAAARALLNVANGADVTNASSVAAAGAIMDSDLAGSELGAMRRTGAGAYAVTKDNLAASAAPTSSDDSSSGGYSAGSIWVDTTAKKVYVCAFTVGAGDAVWKEADVGAGSGTVNSASNQGTGVGVFDNLATDDLEFRTLVDEGGADVAFVLDAPSKEIRVRPGAWYRHFARVWKIPGLAALAHDGFELAPTVRGTPTSADDATGAWLQTATTAAIGATAGVIDGTFRTMRRDWNGVWAARVRVANDLTSVREWIGLANKDPEDSDQPSNAHLAAFRFSTAAGDSNLMAVTAGGATYEITDTGITPTPDAEYLLRIELHAGGVRFFVDDLEVADNLVRKPGPTILLGFFHTVTALAASVRSIKDSRFPWSHD